MKDKGPKAGGDPASATLGWFAMMGPVNGEIEAQMKRVQSFSSDVQTAYLEAFARHMESREYGQPAICPFASGPRASASTPRGIG